MMHGRHWRGENVAGWAVCEKLDGCRGYWDGSRMWSRSGRHFEIPAAWRSALPKMHLEGEIWAGRNRWETTVAAVVRNDWAPSVCFMVFDAPKEKGTWSERISRAAKAVRCNFAAAVPWQFVRDVRQLAKIFRSVGLGGGEGLMLRCPASEGYRPGRGSAVLKLTKDPLTGFVPPARILVERRLRFDRKV